MQPISNTFIIHENSARHIQKQRTEIREAVYIGKIHISKDAVLLPENFKMHERFIYMDCKLAPEKLLVKICLIYV